MMKTKRPQDAPTHSLAMRQVAPFTHPASIVIETRSAEAQILGMAQVLPRHRYAQRDILELLGYAGNRAAESIFRNSCVESRHLVMEPEGFARTHDPSYQDRLFTEGTFELASEAIRAVLASGTSIDPLGCLVVSCSSGFQMPSLSARLVNELRLPPTLVKYDVAGAGCVGAIPAMGIARDYLSAHPDKRVLLLCLEVASQVLRRADPKDKEAMVANALFADAAVAMVLGTGSASPGQPEVRDTQYLQAYDSLDGAFLCKSGHGAWEPHLHKGMPDRSVNLFLPAIDELLARHDLSRESIRHWAFHPGGRAILDRLQGELKLSDEQMAPSRETLRQYGNASGPTCLLVLNRIQDAGVARPGDWGMVAAIGPGLTVGLALVRWPKP